MKTMAGFVCIWLVCCMSAVSAADLHVPGKYRLQARISMPNLDENLRAAGYAKSLCISRASDLFPVLQQPALEGCLLRAGDTKPVYQLMCESGGTRGEAKLSRQGERWRGRLAVKMGGKNMTFSQHVTAEHIGRC